MGNSLSYQNKIKQQCDEKRRLISQEITKYLDFLLLSKLTTPTCCSQNDVIHSSTNTGSVNTSSNDDLYLQSLLGKIDGELSQVVNGFNEIDSLVSTLEIKKLILFANTEKYLIRKLVDILKDSIKIFRDICSHQYFLNEKDLIASLYSHCDDISKAFRLDIPDIYSNFDSVETYVSFLNKYLYQNIAIISRDHILTVCRQLRKNFYDDIDRLHCHAIASKVFSGLYPPKSTAFMVDLNATCKRYIEDINRLDFPTLSSQFDDLKVEICIHCDKLIRYVQMSHADYGEGLDVLLDMYQKTQVEHQITDNCVDIGPVIPKSAKKGTKRQSISTEIDNNIEASTVKKRRKSIKFTNTPKK